MISETKFSLEIYFPRVFCSVEAMCSASGGIMFKPHSCGIIFAQYFCAMKSFFQSSGNLADVQHDMFLWRYICAHFLLGESEVSAHVFSNF